VLPHQFLKAQHLRAAFDLKHADRIGSLNDSIDFVIFGQLREINPVTVKLRNQIEAVGENRRGC
jgi:hypothetical protein